MSSKGKSTGYAPLTLPYRKRGSFVATTLPHPHTSSFLAFHRGVGAFHANHPRMLAPASAVVADHNLVAPCQSILRMVMVSFCRLTLSSVWVLVRQSNLILSPAFWENHLKGLAI
jgi:hypothetical protein